MTKTAGGHRRIEVAAVIKFLRETGRQVVEPELLNLKTRSRIARTHIQSRSVGQLFQRAVSQNSRGRAVSIASQSVSNGKLVPSKVVFQPMFRRTTSDMVIGNV